MKKFCVLALACAVFLALAPSARASEDPPEIQTMTANATVATGQPLFQSAACIESSVVQTSPIAASMGVGNRFYANGMSYVITTGLPSCHFNCHMGFDINCDGRLGDYCPANLNLTRVKDVGTCLALIAAPAAPAAAPAAAPQAAPVTSLAHTGSETDALFEASLALFAVGGGVSALAIRRRRAQG